MIGDVSELLSSKPLGAIGESQMEWLSIMLASILIAALFVWIAYRFQFRRVVGYIVICSGNVILIATWSAIWIWLLLSNGGSTESIEVSRYIDEWIIFSIYPIIFGVIAGFSINAGKRYYVKHGDFPRRAAYGALGIFLGFVLNVFVLCFVMWLIFIAYGKAYY